MARQGARHSLYSGVHSGVDAAVSDRVDAAVSDRVDEDVVLDHEQICRYMTTSTLPDLSRLSLITAEALKRPAPGDGVYCLDSVEDLTACKSSMILVRNAGVFTPAMTDYLDKFMSDDNLVSRTPNPMNPKTNLKRKQVTFGAAYNFGQKQDVIPGPPETWPLAVQSALQASKEFAESLGVDPTLYNGAHVNLYANGSAGVAAHSDSEGDMVAGLPIFSFTLLAGRVEPRAFVILRDANTAEVESQRKDADDKFEGKLATARAHGKPTDKLKKPKFSAALIELYSVLLGHGDVLVMQGMMQTCYKHAVPPNNRVAFKDARRLNITVRAFNATAVR